MGKVGNNRIITSNPNFDYSQVKGSGLLNVVRFETRLLPYRDNLKEQKITSFEPNIYNSCDG